MPQRGADEEQVGRPLVEVHGEPVTEGVGGDGLGDAGGLAPGAEASLNVPDCDPAPCPAGEHGARSAAPEEALQQLASGLGNEDPLLTPPLHAAQVEDASFQVQVLDVERKSRGEAHARGEQQLHKHPIAASLVPFSLA